MRTRADERPSELGGVGPGNSLTPGARVLGRALVDGRGRDFTVRGAVVTGRGRGRRGAATAATHQGERPDHRDEEGNGTQTLGQRHLILLVASHGESGKHKAMSQRMNRCPVMLFD